ncbi:MAG: L,D-transpeptidase, partial [Anaerolineales bacterium]
MNNSGLVETPRWGVSRRHWRSLVHLSTRLLLSASATLILAGLTPAYASPAPAVPSSPVFRPSSSILHPSSFALDPPLCSANLQLQHPTGCADLGPGQYAAEIASAGLSFPMPRLDITPLLPYRGYTPAAYGKIMTDTAPVYRHPYDALAGLPPVRTFIKGFEFVSLMGSVTVDGQDFYQINPGEFVPAADLKEVRPSGFQGRFISDPPSTPVGWVINNVVPSAVPGEAPAADAVGVGRYQAFDVLGEQQVGEWKWYLIGPGQWVEQRNVALVWPNPPGGAGGTLIAVDTYEQTLGVYQDGRLIFATLVSSGSRYFPTRPGTFHVWARLDSGKMSGAYLADKRDYYF